MTLAIKTAWDDTVLPFQLDNSDIRGRVSRLDGVLAGPMIRRKVDLISSGETKSGQSITIPNSTFYAGVPAKFIKKIN